MIEEIGIPGCHISLITKCLVLELVIGAEIGLQDDVAASSISGASEVGPITTNKNSEFLTPNRLCKPNCCPTSVVKPVWAVQRARIEASLRETGNAWTRMRYSVIHHGCRTWDQFGTFVSKVLRLR